MAPRPVALLATMAGVAVLVAGAASGGRPAAPGRLSLAEPAPLVRTAHAATPRVRAARFLDGSAPRSWTAWCR